LTATATRTDSGFNNLGLHETILQGIDFAGFTEPRPIQIQTIPAALEGRDVLGLAQTGNGKTAAFGIPLLDRLREHRKQAPRALIIAPTRELATQIAEEMRQLARHTGMRIITIFGGASQRMQVGALRRNPDIVVGCPGRVLDLAQQGYLKLNQVETLVLDEADHMFDMGFLPTIRRIMKELPKKRQNLLFSATMPADIRGLASEILDNPHTVELANRQPAETIDHALMAVAEAKKRDLLELILQREDCKSAIIFTRTKHRARRLAEQLQNAKHNAIALQGNMSQNARDRAMRGFREGQFKILVATDIVARGIDVQGVSYVINFDVPTTAEAYTHRIGRTGRSEQEGMALTFITRDDHRWVKAVEKMLGTEIQRKRERGFDAGFDDKNAPPMPRVAGAYGKKPGGGGGRGSTPGGQRRSAGRNHDEDRSGPPKSPFGGPRRKPTNKSAGKWKGPSGGGGRSGGGGTGGSQRTGSGRVGSR
jgi:ATP-dependent RNA helicase RhlE